LRDRLDSLQASKALEQLDYTHEEALLYGQSLAYNQLDRIEQSLNLVNQALEQEKNLRSVVRSEPAPLLLKSHQMSLLIRQRASLNGGVDAMSPIRTRSQLNEPDQALLAQLESYLADYSDAYSVKVEYVAGLQSMGLFAESEAQLRDLLQLYRSRPELYDLLAKANLAQGQQAQYHFALAQAYGTRGAYRPAVEQTRLARRHAQDDYYLAAEIEALQKKYKQAEENDRRFAENFR
ncbi:MAG: hypothetical protein R3194_13530, partial [Limnobacter sp.]|nr:hypothetical protein [Limnobacter sp.]